MTKLSAALNVDDEQFFLCFYRSILSSHSFTFNFLRFPLFFTFTFVENFPFTKQNGAGIGESLFVGGRSESRMLFV